VRRLALAFFLAFAPLSVFAVEPDEMLADPVLEARARALTSGLRCLVCQNQSIDDSNAELARDLRLLVRERLVAGDSDEQAVAYLVDRYGTFILLEPPVTAATLALWAGPLALLIAAGAGFATVLRRRSGAPDVPQDMMTKDDKAMVARALAGKDNT
jgi:cytochrome c-type biogenesis protein CcmH